MALETAWIVLMVALSCFLTVRTQDIDAGNTPDVSDGYLGSLPLYEQTWGYVTVRPGAHKFWWLMATTHEEGYARRPLVIWLQGGPGAASTSFGLFRIIGPVDEDLRDRAYSWVSEASLLFVDHPVGVGFSYVDDEQDFTKNMEEDAEDLLRLLQGFLERNPMFRIPPLYVFGQSYGGKMAAAFVRRLHRAIDQEEILCNLRGLAMGNAWISPEDSTMTWAPFLHWMSFIDDLEMEGILQKALQCMEAINARQWTNATELWMATQYEIIDLVDVDWYNVLRLPKRTALLEKRFAGTQGDGMGSGFPILPGAQLKHQLMEGAVRDFLGSAIPNNLTYKTVSYEVFRNHAADFMKPAVHIVEELLQTTDLDIIVYQGTLDLICDTVGATNWVQKLQWSGAEEFRRRPRTPVPNEEGQVDLYAKGLGHFKFYWLINAGHASPEDQPVTALRMLRRIFDGTDT